MTTRGDGKGREGCRIRVAAAQPLSAKARLMGQLEGNPEARRDHFLKYNIGAATYDDAYARAYGEAYLPYLESWVRKATARKVDLLLFPEFCFTPGVLAAPATGAAANRHGFADAVRLYTWSGTLFSEWLCRWSRETGMFIGAAAFTAQKGKLHNTGLLADPAGRIALRYHKIHLPPDEARYLTPGRDYAVASTALGRIGFSICYDIQFPEAAACLAVRGAQIVLHPSAGFTLPDEQRDMGHNRLRVRASDHFASYAYSSFAPVESGGPGGTCVVAPNGDLLATVREAKCGLAVADVTVGGKRMWPKDGAGAPDREAVRRRYRRPGTYGGLLRKA